LVAAGRFDGTGKTVFAMNGLAAKQLPLPQIFLMTFTGYKDTLHYTVTGTPVTSTGAVGRMFEIIQLPDPKLAGVTDKDGLVVRISVADTAPLLGFIVEISQLPG
jgi:hypothetical protein